MNEGQRQQEGSKAVHHTLFVYSKPGNKKESQRIPFIRNPKPPLYQSRVAEMKKNFRSTPVKRAVRRTVPKSDIQWHVETKPKTAVQMKQEMIHMVTNTKTASFDDQQLMFPDDLELSFCSGQLNTSKQLEMSTSSTVPDIDSSTHQHNTETQEFYQIPTPSKQPNVKSRKRTYRDFPNYTHKKPFYGSDYTS